MWIYQTTGRPVANRCGRRRSAMTRMNSATRRFTRYGLNFLDVVEARSASPGQKPTVLRVVRRSGHRTLRLRFSDPALAPDRLRRLESLATLGAAFEGRDDVFFAIDVSPEGNYQAVCDRLAAWSGEGALDYETCEARVVGSFDDRPTDPQRDAAG